LPRNVNFFEPSSDRACVASGTMSAQSCQCGCADRPQVAVPFREYYAKHFKSTLAEGLASRLFQKEKTPVEVPSDGKSEHTADQTSKDGEMSLPLRKDFQEAFDARNVSNEYLEHLAYIEKQALEPVVGNSNLMPMQVRDTVHRYLQHVTQLVGLPVQKYFEAATLLDCYHLKNQDGVSIATLAVTCSALVMILKKNDNATAHMSACQLAPHAAQMAQWLQRRGIPNVAVDVTERMLLAAESNVLEVLEWRISVPTVESWTSTFCARFNILTQSLFMASMNWVWQQSLMMSRMIMTRQALSKETSPQKLAVGLLGLGLVAAQLLPGDALRPSKIPPAEWEQLYIESQPQGVMPECVLPKDHARCLLDIVQATVTWSLFELQEACYLTASVVRDGLMDMQAMQQAARAQAQSVQHTSL